MSTDGAGRGSGKGYVESRMDPESKIVFRGVDFGKVPATGRHWPSARSSRHVTSACDRLQTIRAAHVHHGSAAVVGDLPRSRPTDAAARAGYGHCLALRHGRRLCRHARSSPGGRSAVDGPGGLLVVTISLHFDLAGGVSDFQQVFVGKVERRRPKVLF